MNAKMLAISLATGVAAATGRADDAVLQSGEMYPLADGGVLHVFRQDGTLKVKSPGNISFVLVGGGGAGGDHRGGGGGAGGVVTNAEYYLNAGSYNISIGTGAKQAFTEYILDETGEVKTNRAFTVSDGQTVTTNKYAAIAATATTFGDLFTAYPGGNGGGVRAGGSDGASGGGGGGFMKEPKSGGKAIYADAGNLGNAGGTSLWMESPGATGAGGGGAGTPGEDRTNHVDNIYSMIGGHGGTGVVTRITGKDFWIGGGGNAQGVSDVVPGGGGKGTASTSSAVNKGGNGAAYTGGGGGGSGSGGNDGGLGGDGGSGVAFFRTEGALPEIIFSDGVRGTGGTIKEKSSHGARWCIHTFTEDGTFTLPEGTVVEMLLVGGGGGGGAGGGNQHAAGGGGGGRVVVSTNYLAAGSYAVVVGQGGEMEVNGADSTFFGYCAKGGGAGGSVRQGGDAGGCSGGGGAWGTGDFSPGAVTAATNDWGSLGLPIEVALETQYGYSGGIGRLYHGAGGGGAGAPGADGTNSKPGAGGDGFESDITGKSVCYGGGGGGGGVGSSTFWDNGGAGGGGAGGGSNSNSNSDAQSYGLPGTDGLGGGGGGGGGGSNNGISNVSGGKGGSGVVILRYRIEPTGFLMLVR